VRTNRVFFLFCVASNTESRKGKKVNTTRKTNKLTQVLAIFCVIAFMGVSMPSAQAGPPWDQTHKLLGSDGAKDDEFGYSVAVSGNLAVVGSYQDDDNGSNSGSAYVFDVNTGQQLFKLRPDDGAIYEYFGNSVAANGNIAVIGAYQDDDNGDLSGSAYVFDITTGQQLFKLLPDDGSYGDEFGYSVAVSGNIAVIGAFRDDDFGSNTGAIYIFDVTTGQQLFKLLADDSAAHDLFGYSVALSGNLAVVGAFFDNDNGVDSGSAYVFDVSAGQQLFKLLPSDGTTDDNFGRSVAVSGNLAVIGADTDDDNGFRSGSAYTFDVLTGQQLFKILLPDGAIDDFFGHSVAITGHTAVIGSFGDDDHGSNSGSAYVYEQSTSNCLDLTVDNLIAGNIATFTITGGNPRAKAVTLYGTELGETMIENYADYCATFGFNTNQNKVIGGIHHLFDSNGEIIFHQLIPRGAIGTQVFFQSAMQGTCPNECISNLVEMTVQ